ncbi:hypothetical protein ABF86_06625 [Nitrosomonas sp. GH22]|nr:hypothetical protein [Nitrosomonas sp. GH22]
MNLFMLFWAIALKVPGGQIAGWYCVFARSSSIIADIFPTMKNSFHNPAPGNDCKSVQFTSPGDLATTSPKQT